MKYHRFRDSFERNDFLDVLDTFIYGTFEYINLRDMFLLRCSIQAYAEIIHLHTQRFKLAIIMYACYFEATLQVQLVDLFNSIFNIISISIFNNTFCGKHDVLVYGVKEANGVDVHDVTSQVDFILFVKDILVDTCYHNRYHMLNPVQNYFALQMWHTGSIYVLSHPYV